MVLLYSSTQRRNDNNDNNNNAHISRMCATCVRVGRTKKGPKTVSIGPGRKRAKPVSAFAKITDCPTRTPCTRRFIRYIFIFGFRRVCILLATYCTHCPRICVYYVDVWDFDNHTHDTRIHRKINIGTRSTTCIVVGW